MRQTVRLHRRRINLSFRRWHEIRGRHPKAREATTLENGVRLIAHTLPITEYGLTTDRLHSVSNTQEIDRLRDFFSRSLVAANEADLWPCSSQRDTVDA